MKKSSNAKKTKRTRTKVGPKGKRTPKESIKKMVKAEIHRQIENKTVQLFSSVSLYNAKTVDFDALNIIPMTQFVASLAQGTGQGDRLGNQINIRKLQFKGTLVPLPFADPTNETPRPVQVKMTIMSLKQDPVANPTPFADGNIFQFGNSDQTFTATLADMWLPFNQDYYKIYTSKVFKLGNQIYNGTDVGANDAASFFSNNDFKLNCNFSFDLTKHVPKIMRWNDGSGVPGAVISRQLFCMVEYVYADGTITSDATVAVGIQYMLNCVYEDA